MERGRSRGLSMGLMWKSKRQAVVGREWSYGGGGRKLPPPSQIFPREKLIRNDAVLAIDHSVKERFLPSPPRPYSLPSNPSHSFHSSFLVTSPCSYFVSFHVLSFRLLNWPVSDYHPFPCSACQSTWKLVPPPLNPRETFPYKYLTPPRLTTFFPLAQTTGCPAHLPYFISFRFISVQFSSVQFSSVQFSSVQFI